MIRRWLKWRPLKSAGFSEGTWVMPMIIHNYQVCTRTLFEQYTATCAIGRARPLRRGTTNRLSDVVRLSSIDESVPRPLRDLQTIRHILCRVVITSHRGSRGPREVIVQHASEALVAREPDIFQRLIETRDRPLVHLLVRPVAAMNPDDRGFIAIPVGVDRWPTECLRPVRGKALSVLRVVTVAERMANYFVL